MSCGDGHEPTWRVWRVSTAPALSDVLRIGRDRGAKAEAPTAGRVSVCGEVEGQGVRVHGQWNDTDRRRSPPSSRAGE